MILKIPGSVAWTPLGAHPKTGALPHFQIRPGATVHRAAMIPASVAFSELCQWKLLEPLPKLTL